MKIETILDIRRAVKAARAKHPEFPADIVHRAAILAEESGEVVQATLNNVYHSGRRDRIRKEVLDTIAVCIRMLENE